MPEREFVRVLVCAYALQMFAASFDSFFCERESGCLCACMYVLKGCVCYIYINKYIYIFRARELLMIDIWGGYA